MPPTDGFDGLALIWCRGECGWSSSTVTKRIEAVAHRRRQTLRHALRQQRAGRLSGQPAPRGAAPSRPARERAPSRKPRALPAPALRRCARTVAPRLRGNRASRSLAAASKQVTADALLMFGDRLLPRVFLVGTLHLAGGRSRSPKP